MFAKTIIDSDAFLDMPLSTQSLYFHLSMRADDDGFINNPRKIQRMIGSSEDDLKLLLAKKFLIVFESGVVVIKHWKIHNYIQPDRYKETIYKDEKSQLLLKENKSYKLMDTQCIQNGYSSDTQVRLGKDRLEIELGKDSIELDNSISKDILVPKDLVPIQEAWNSLGLSKINSIKGNRLKLLKARIKEYGIDTILKAIESIRNSSFLKGQNKTGWVIVFDWLIKPNNFPKVLEGNYTDKEGNYGNYSGSNKENTSDYTGIKRQADIAAPGAPTREELRRAEENGEFD
jgi:hypothetical protein